MVKERNMSAQIISVDIIPVTSRTEAARPAPILDHASFEDGEANGLRAAKGITLGIILSFPVWLAIGAVCYIVF